MISVFFKEALVSLMFSTKLTAAPAPTVAALAIPPPIFKDFVVWLALTLTSLPTVICALPTSDVTLDSLSCTLTEPAAATEMFFDSPFLEFKLSRFAASLPVEPWNLTSFVESPSEAVNSFPLASL